MHLINKENNHEFQILVSSCAFVPQATYRLNAEALKKCKASCRDGDKMGFH